MPLALELAEFVTKTRFEDLPPLTIERAKMVIASTFASAAVGTEIESARIVRSLAKDKAGAQQASVWFDGAGLPLAEAARVNAMLSDAAASDDSDIRNVAHIGTVATAAALAAGEPANATGRNVLAALALGYEVSGRLGGAVNPGSLGFHATTITIFAPCVAAAKLLGLDANQTAHAIALAATSTGGLGMSTNSWAREYHAGNSALLGVNAALAAQRGYEAQLDMLDAPRGYVSAFGGSDGLAAVTEGLGKRWDIIDHIAFKLYPGAHPFHAVLEAAINASRDGNVRPDDVERIVVAGPRFRAQNAGWSAHPKDLAATIHSLPYYMAAGVADKEFTWDHVSEEKVRRPVIDSLQERVSIDPDPQDLPALKWTWGGRVTIHTKSGGSFASVVDASKGSGPRGVSWDEIDYKYRALMPASGLSNERVDQSLDAIKRLDEAPGVGPLLALLV
jgi:2-methylcitrate dehydratase PrpD